MRLSYYARYDANITEIVILTQTHFSGRSPEFPEMKGFSTRNLKYIRKFAKAYLDIEFVQELLAQLTWYHNITLLDKVPDKQARLFYVKYAIEHVWSRNINGYAN